MQQTIVANIIPAAEYRGKRRSEQSSPQPQKEVN